MKRTLRVITNAAAAVLAVSALARDTSAPLKSTDNKKIKSCIITSNV